MSIRTYKTEGTLVLIDENKREYVVQRIVEYIDGLRHGSYFQTKDGQRVDPRPDGGYVIGATGVKLTRKDSAAP
jgi:hypothetical protein